MRQTLQQIAILALAALQGACNEEGSSDAPSTGTASFAVTDAPVDGVSRVRVTVDRIELKPASGEKIRIDLDPVVTIENLLALSGDLAAPLLASTEVPAGDYNYIRVYVQAGSPASEVEVDSGGIFDLLLPGQQTGNDNRFLQLVSGFTVPAGGRADFTIDIDLRKALTKPSDKDHYLLRPALRLINNVDVGTLSGSVDSALLQDASCTNDIAADEGVTVYLYRDGSEPLGDINVDEVGEGDHPVDDADGFVDEINPIATAAVKQNQNTGVYEYTLGFIPDGSYRVALTCQSLNDMPDTDEGLAFLQQARVTIVAGQTAMLNFVAANP
ncbi:MAG TPA: hypothetical protein DIW43_12275 [Spongiibacteraceae bacterium]|nr:hypothetical protein [Spongiibacteraceae bacterium]HCS28225.1 hypothetical protein [Spongiibacteraceae bacterium]